MNLTVLILAAGRGRRFGSDKRRYLIDGEPMLVKTTSIYASLFDDVRVVLRPGDEDLAAAVAELGATIIEAADADAGQSRTLAAGVASLDGTDRVLVALGDMPFVAQATLRSLRDHETTRPIVRPHHGGRAGNPIRFDAEIFPELLGIDGDQGAREIVKADPTRVELLEVDDQGVLADVDRPLSSAD